MQALARTHSRAVGPPDDIVHVADHAADAAALQQQPVEAGEIVVGEMLGGQCADRQPLAGRS